MVSSATSVELCYYEGQQLEVTEEFETEFKSLNGLHFGLPDGLSHGPSPLEYITGNKEERLAEADWTPIKGRTFKYEKGDGLAKYVCGFLNCRDLSSSRPGTLYFGVTDSGFIEAQPICRSLGCTCKPRCADAHLTHPRCAIRAAQDRIGKCVDDVVRQISPSVDGSLVKVEFVPVNSDVANARHVAAELGLNQDEALADAEDLLLGGVRLDPPLDAARTDALLRSARAAVAAGAHGDSELAQVVAALAGRSTAEATEVVPDRSCYVIRMVVYRPAERGQELPMFFKKVSYGLCSYGLYSYGLCSYDPVIAMAYIVMAKKEDSLVGYIRKNKSTDHLSPRSVREILKQERLRAEASGDYQRLSWRHLEPEYDPLGPITYGRKPLDRILLRYDQRAVVREKRLGVGEPGLSEKQERGIVCERFWLQRAIRDRP